MSLTEGTVSGDTRRCFLFGHSSMRLGRESSSSSSTRCGRESADEPESRKVPLVKECKANNMLA